MYCGKCGKKNQDGADYCGSCGTYLRQGPPVDGQEYGTAGEPQCGFGDRGIGRVVLKEDRRPFLYWFLLSEVLAFLLSFLGINLGIFFVVVNLFVKNVVFARYPASDNILINVRSGGPLLTAFRRTLFDFSQRELNRYFFAGSLFSWVAQYAVSYIGASFLVSLGLLFLSDSITTVLLYRWLKTSRLRSQAARTTAAVPSVQDTTDVDFAPIRNPLADEEAEAWAAIPDQVKRASVKKVLVGEIWKGFGWIIGGIALTALTYNIAPGGIICAASVVAPSEPPIGSYLDLAGGLSVKCVRLRRRFPSVPLRLVLDCNEVWNQKAIT